MTFLMNIEVLAEKRIQAYPSQDSILQYQSALYIYLNHLSEPFVVYNLTFFRLKFRNSVKYIQC